MRGLFVSLGLACILTGTPLVSATPPDPLTIAAEYYYDHQDYRQSLQLWEQILARQPNNLTALSRVSDLKLMFEGRAAGRKTLFHFLSANASNLSGDLRRALREKVEAAANVFLTDEGQTAYLQALPKVKEKDFAGALSLLTQAANLEAGNVRVLRFKARCERGLAVYRPFQETLTVALESDPFDAQIAESLSEADLYFSEPSKVVNRYRESPELLRSMRAKVAYGVALASAGERTEALSLLQGLVQEQRGNTVIPVVLFTLGDLLSQKPDTVPAATAFLERYLGYLSHPESVLIDGWDPYRSLERAADVQKLLASLKASKN